jgi:dephospho-CoA kinase
MFVLGIVGAVAGGKSTAAEHLASLGADWINADLIARECLQDTDIVTALRQRFGAGVIDAEGKVDRKQVAERVFGTSPEKRAALAFLESLVHPRTRTRILNRIEQAAERKVCVGLLDVPLLFESGWHLGCDAVWCITASRENRIKRLEKRGWDEAELVRREVNQLPIETKCQLSNLVMQNDSTLEALRENLTRRYQQIVRMEALAPRPSPDGRRHCRSDWCVD